MIYLFLGAMKHMDEKGLFNDIQEISCASCGSLIGLFFVLFAGDMDRICQVAFDTCLGSAAKADIKTFINKFGFVDASKIEKVIIQNLDGADPTFKELYDMNPIKLHIPTYEMLSGRTIYMSVDTTPDMKVSRAVRRSISVPIVFTPCIEDGCVYLDGSTIEVSPYAPFLGKNDVIEIRWRRHPTMKSIPKNITQFVKTFIFGFFENSRNSGDTYLDFDRIDLYSSNDSLSYDFNMSIENKVMLFNEGYSQVL